MSERRERSAHPNVILFRRLTCPTCGYGLCVPDGKHVPFRCGYDDTLFDVEIVTEADYEAIPPAEPTDAEVKAATQAWWDSHHLRGQEAESAIRAALEAFLAARKEQS
jgi:hypothetical protein